ncbi:MAG: Na+-dependent transporter, partial [Candidatus Methanomethylophilaceae archaeon]|nr:Na+-dependent transporter [Candidatus Methanomethylophilaceae archaeon]
IPVLVWLTLGESVNMADVVISVAEVMVLPLFLSRLITRVKIDKYVMAVVLNCAIFMLVVLSVGATANFFRSEATLLLIFMGIAVLRTFVLGVGLEFIERRLGIKWSQRVTDVLMTSYKNKGVAIALCMAVLPAAALFPITASIVVEICWVIFMDAVLFSKRRMSRELRREGSEPVDPAVSP